MSTALPAIHTIKRTVPYLRVDTANAETQVACAGALWAGRSELPMAQISPAQLMALKADSRLQVTEFEREVDPDAEAPAT